MGQQESNSPRAPNPNRGAYDNMKVNVACPSTGAQKQIKVDEDSKLRAFYDKRLAAEVPGDVLGDEWKGYILKIAGGNDKQGFGMKQGCLIPGRCKILMAPGDQCFRGYGRMTMSGSTSTSTAGPRRRTGRPTPRRQRSRG